MSKKPNKTAVYTLNFWEKIQYALVFSFVYCLSLLPLRVLYILTGGIYLLAYRLIGYRTDVVRKNIRDSFPDKSEKERKKIEKDFYHFLADYIAETIKLMTMSKKEMARRMTVSNYELIGEAEAKGQTVAAFLGHYCNWEWVTGIAIHFAPASYGSQVYHVMENKVFDKLFLHIRERMGSKCIAMADILRRRIECLRRNQPMVIGYIADQVPFWNNIHYWTNFLNHDTPVLTGAETLTKRFGDRAVYLDLRRVRRGYYHIDVKPLFLDTKDVPDWEITEKYYRELEQTILRQPAFYLWSHNRWKRTREEYNQRLLEKEKSAN